MKSKTGKYLVIIQARTDSKRLPNKVLSNIERRPLLWHVIERVKKMRNSRVIIATTDRKIDDDIIKIAEKCGVGYFRGKTKDVLDRYFKAAMKFDGDIIVRITADCPLIDPYESEKVVKKFLSKNYDYVSNDSETYPNGLDTECFSFLALKKAWKCAKLKSEREHVTPYIWKNPTQFKIGFVHNKTRTRLDNLKWSVDYLDDIKFVKKVYSRLYNSDDIFLRKDILFYI